MRHLIVGNWKMNGLLEEAARIAGPLRDGAADAGCELVVCPPFTVLRAVAEMLAGSSVAVGGQDCHDQVAGAFTGDVSAAMLRDAGASWVIVGHSERRVGHFERNADVRAKALAAQAAGLNPIVCVGETHDDRAAGRAVAVVTRQIRDSLPPSYAGTVAYEPIWAIGTGRLPSEKEVSEMHDGLRSLVGPSVRLLYGGSVKPDNAAALMRLSNVDGALVGGASLKAAEFLGIARAAVGASP